MNTNTKEFMSQNMYALGALGVVIIVLIIVIFSGPNNNNVTKEKIHASQLVVASSQLIYDCDTPNADILYSFAFQQNGENKVALTEVIGTGCPDAELLEKSQKIKDEEIVFSKDYTQLTRENGTIYPVQIIVAN